MSAETLLAHRFARLHASEAAAILESFSLEQAVAALVEMPPDLMAEMLNLLDAVRAASYLSHMAADRAAAAVALLPLDPASAIVRRLDAEESQALIDRLPPDSAEPLGELLRYPEGSAGALMNPRALSVPNDIDVHEALKRLGENAADAGYYMYIVDRQRKLVGVVNVRELMLATPEASIASVMHADVVSLRARTSLAAIAVHPGWLEYQVLPVVDPQGQLLGALRHKTLRRLASQVNQRRGSNLGTAGTALGELFQIGLSGIVNVAGGLTPSQSAEGRHEE